MALTLTADNLFVNILLIINRLGFARWANSDWRLVNGRLGLYRGYYFTVFTS